MRPTGLCVDHTTGSTPSQEHTFSSRSRLESLAASRTHCAAKSRQDESFNFAPQVIATHVGRLDRLHFGPPRGSEGRCAETSHSTSLWASDSSESLNPPDEFVGV